MPSKTPNKVTGANADGPRQLNTDALGRPRRSVLAIRAGFERVLFIIRRDFEQEFRERIGHPSNLEVGEVAR
jgi:hypothetical protein